MTQVVPKIAPEDDPTLDHGSASTYTNHRCRCVPCRAANTARARERRRTRRSQRILVGTRLVTTANVQHGRASTYSNWGCQCWDCTEAHRLRKRNSGVRETRPTSNGFVLTDELLDALAAEAERNYDVSEY